MIGQLLGQEDEFSLRLHRGRAFVPIKHVNCQCPVDQDRLVGVFREEMESSSQASRPRLAGWYMTVSVHMAVTDLGVTGSSSFSNDF